MKTNVDLFPLISFKCWKSDSDIKKGEKGGLDLRTASETVFSRSLAITDKDFYSSLSTMFCSVLQETRE